MGRFKVKVCAWLKNHQEEYILIIFSLGNGQSEHFWGSQEILLEMIQWKWHSEIQDLRILSLYMDTLPWDFGKHEVTNMEKNFAVWMT